MSDPPSHFNGMNACPCFCVSIQRQWAKTGGGGACFCKDKYLLMAYKDKYLLMAYKDKYLLMAYKDKYLLMTGHQQVFVFIKSRAISH